MVEGLRRWILGRFVMQGRRLGGVRRVRSGPFFEAALCTSLIALLSSCVFAEAPKFQNSDRVCFIGDSITQQAHYHTQILLFYATRFPQMRLTTWNCGLAGDSAAGAVRRYAWDIAPRKPTVATIMLGMNDVGRSLYAEDKSGPQVEARRRQAIGSNTNNMGKLVGLLAQDGARIILITPSLFDQTGNQKTERLFGVNDALKACGEAARNLAHQHKQGFVDFNGPMEDMNKTGQGRDPNFTIVGNDRVHPGPVGHLVMAYLFLRAQGMSPTVAHMEIDAARRTIVVQDNCEISALSMTNGTLSFACLENALPFPTDTTNQEALRLVPFMAELNRETLKVSGLPDGQHQVWIDGKLVLETTAAALRDGVNMAAVKETPQYQQAQNVHRLVTQRAEIESRKLRIFAQVEHSFFSGLKERSPEIERKVLEEGLAAAKKSDSVLGRYRAGVIEAYWKLIPEKENFERQAAERMVEVYVANKPKPHHYAIRPVPSTRP